MENRQALPQRLFADESNSFGIGIDGLAKALKPLRRVDRVADDRVVDPVRRADIADNDRAHMHAHADPRVRRPPRGVGGGGVGQRRDGRGACGVGSCEIGIHVGGAGRDFEGARFWGGGGL